MRKNNTNLFVLGAVVLTLSLFGCNSGKTADTTAAGALIDGASLYNKDCSGCHGSLATSGKKGATVAQIQDAISHNWGGMGVFVNLTADQIQAIAAALPAQVTTTTDTTTDTTTTLDGAALYTANCSSCHGALAASGKSGALASAVQAAITSNSGGMGRFSNLTTAQVQAIADALATVPASTPAPGGASQTLDGAALYAKYCQGCHKPLASSRKTGASVSRIQAGISSEPGMKSLSTLSQAQLDAIASALGAPASGSPSSSGGSTTSTDGAALYTQHCETCHDPLVASMKAGKTALQIQTAISNNKGGMGYLSTLSTVQIDAIASALAAAPTPASTDGAALYTNNCSGCHDPLAISKVRGAAASAISTAIASVGQMSSISLTSTEIQAIATALGTTTGGSATCTSFTYSTWGACQSDSTQTRSLASSSPSGCTGGTPVLSQACNYVPTSSTPCTFTYSAWGACQSNSTQTRTMASSSPAGCTGTPVLSQTCTYVPTVDGAALYNSNCSSTSCHGPLASSAKLGRTASQIQTAITSNRGGMGSLSSLTTAQIDAIASALAINCTSFTYSAWGTCQSDSTQTRNMTSSAPAGCTGGTPVLSQVCTYVPPVNACTSFTYSAWGACQSNSTQSRTVSISSPTGCTGGTPVLSQACTYVPPTQACGSCHAIPPATGQHSRHYPSKATCSTCHGSGYSPTAVTAATHQNGVVNMASTPGWNPSTRSCSNSCHGTEKWGGSTTAAPTTPAPATTTTSGSIDGATLYATYCADCHGPLATSGHRGATASQIQAGINTISGMMSLSTLTAAQIQAISDALYSTTPATTSAPVCGSCHTIPPSSGHHSTHQSRACSVCHGAGYSSTTNNVATHNNGVIDIATGSTPGWNPSTRSCSNSCHGSNKW